MKKKIAILGSTGSIGKTLIDIIDKNKKNFDIILLTANKNYKTLLKQAKKFSVKNIIITDKKKYELVKKNHKYKNINIYNNFDKLNIIFKKKIDYTMSSITGIDGFLPTLGLIKFSKTISIANKESIICGWNLIKKELDKYKTNFIPVDSEHFSLWFALKSCDKKSIDKIFITASGGPFYKFSLKEISSAKVSDALNHPNWKMGKKISIDSATMINKVYEVIEAKNIFEIPFKKIKILTHPKSYIHAIIKFNNGLIKLIAHDTTMKIPIFNSLFSSGSKKLKSKDVNLKTLNNLDFQKVDLKKFPMVKLLKHLPLKHSLFETIIVSANDTLVSLYLKKKIKFSEINKKLFKILKLKEFNKFKKTYPRKSSDITELNNYVRLKILKTVYKSQDND